MRRPPPHAAPPAGHHAPLPSSLRRQRRPSPPPSPELCGADGPRYGQLPGILRLVAMVLGPRRPPQLLLRRRAWRSCRCRSTAPLDGDLLPAMAPRGNPPRPPARKEGGGGRAKKGRDGARGGRRHLPSRTSRPPDPAAAATGRARGRRIWPVPPSPRRAGVRQRRRHGRALEEGAREGGVPGTADPPLRSSSSSSAHARRRRCPSRRARRRGRGGEGGGGGGAGEGEGGERGRSTSTTAENPAAPRSAPALLRPNPPHARCSTSSLHDECTPAPQHCR